MTTATVKYAAGPPKDYEHGPRINVLCVLPTGEEVRIYDKPDSAIASWKKGQSVTLEKNEKGYWNPAKGQASAAPTQQASQSTAPNAGFHQRLEAKALDDEATRTAIYSRASFMADLYSAIYYKLSQGDPELPFDEGKIKPEDLHAAAATVFIQVSKIHFDK